jgi:hypothetical protein
LETASPQNKKGEEGKEGVKITTPTETTPPRPLVHGFLALGRFYLFPTEIGLASVQSLQTPYFRLRKIFSLAVYKFIFSANRSVVRKSFEIIFFPKIYLFTNPKETSDTTKSFPSIPSTVEMVVDEKYNHCRLLPELNNKNNKRAQEKTIFLMVEIVSERW